MSTLEQDVHALQSQVRRQRRWNLGLGALVVVGGLMAATAERSVPDVIQAKKFEVVNDEGVAVVKIHSFQGGGVIWGFDKKRVPTFCVTTQTGTDGVSLGTVTTMNGRGQKLVELGVDTEMNGSVITKGGKGGTLVQLGSGPSGGAVTTKNGKGQTLVQLGSNKGGGSVTTKNGNGGTLVQITANSNGGAVTTQNGKGGSLVLIAADRNGGGAVLAQDAEGNIKATLP